MAGVGADDGEPLLQRMRQGPTSAAAAGRGNDRAVEAAIGLIEEAPVPRLWKPHLEADGVRLSVAAGAAEHLAGDQAVRTDSRAADGEHAGGDVDRRVDRGVGR